MFLTVTSFILKYSIKLNRNDKVVYDAKDHCKYLVFLTSKTYISPVLLCMKFFLLMIFMRCLFFMIYEFKDNGTHKRMKCHDNVIMS